MNKLTFTIFIIIILKATTYSQTNGNGVFDIDGNFYPTIVYGNGQEWMAANLNTSSYSNGVAIPNITNSTTWSALTTGAWTYYNDNINFGTTYGKLYNFFVIADSRNVCPVGWSVPTKYAYDSLINFLGGSSIAGGKMKEIGTQNWTTPNTSATNTSLFNAKPNGLKYNSGQYFDIGNKAYLWSSTIDSPNSALRLNLFYNNTNANTQFGANKNSGLGIRCIKYSNGNQTGISPIINSNSIKVFPNPSNSNISIDYSNQEMMIGYSLKITNSIGQEVFQSAITQQVFYIDFTTFNGNGVYFIHTINTQGNTVDIRKVVLQ
jgi:uncharacterized protein (TIGR02145 family)